MGRLLHAAALVSLALLIYNELHTEDPIVDLSILENRHFTLPVALVIFLTFTLYGTAILNPIFLQETARLHRIEGRPGDGAARLRHDVLDDHPRHATRAAAVTSVRWSVSAFLRGVSRCGRCRG